MHRIRILAALVALGTTPCAAELASSASGHKSAAGGGMTTRWTAAVTPDNCWREYPRPQMKRSDWQNLNGLWEFSIRPRSEERPKEFAHKILVPFPAESLLGGVQLRPGPADRMWYRREFRLPASWQGRRVRLHFGAVDWNAEVWVNGRHVGGHQGGYDPFSLDVTEAARFDASNELVVAVDDPTDAGFQPRGKQKLDPREIWYTPVSGVWQTVWLEPTPEESIDAVQITPDAEAGSITVLATVRRGRPGARIEVAVEDQGGAVVATGSGAAGKALTVSIPDPQPWSPEQPVLYGVNVRHLLDDAELDRVDCYCGLRTIRVGPDRNGIQRLLLNGRPLFQYGVLDQGYWPDGLYCPPSDEAIRTELQAAKRLGFNMIRKHVKVEPARWYRWCDEIGLLVWQDMPSGDAPATWPQDGVEITRSAASAAVYRRELRSMIEGLRNFPSIVVWVPFNEGWGQFETKATAQWIRDVDPSRLVVAASGGNDFGVGDLKDDHFYPGPGAPPAEVHRAAALGEFGGFGLPVRGHAWQDEENWGYQSFRSPADLAAAYESALAKLRPLIESRLSAAVYTQLTDVESEVNGLFTYDRRELKIDEARLARASAALLAPLPRLDAEARRAASVLAWWRFEELAADQAVPAISERMGARAVLDESGHNNHLYAFSSASAPSAALTSSTAKKPDPSLGRMCLDDRKPPGEGAPVRDLFTDPNLAGTHMDVLDRYPFAEWTVEASFQATDAGRSQVLLAKQGSPAFGGESPFQLGAFVDADACRVQLAMIDGSGVRRTLTHPQPIVGGKWYRVVVACDGKVLSMQASELEPGGPPETASIHVDGALAPSAGAWIVGRGWRGGEMAFDFRGLLDEIRISTTATPLE